MYNITVLFVENGNSVPIGFLLEFVIEVMGSFGPCTYFFSLEVHPQNGYVYISLLYVIEKIIILTTWFWSLGVSRNYKKTQSNKVLHLGSYVTSGLRGSVRDHLK